MLSNKLQNASIFIDENKNFATGIISLYFKLPLTAHNLAFANLLTNLQSNSSEKYPNITALNTVLEQNYNVRINFNTEIYGCQLLIRYTLNYLEPLELLDAEYNYQAIVDLFCELVLKPNFSADAISYSQRQLAEDYQLAMSDPENYATEQFFKKWYHQERDYTYGFMGPISEILAADVESLRRFFESLKKSPAAIFGIGVNSDALSQLLIDKLSEYSLKRDFSANDLVIASLPDPVVKTEEKNLSQAIVNLGFGFDSELNARERKIAKILAIYLGGLDNSILFAKVREKLGAAYYVRADAYVNNSLLLVSAGLNHEKMSAGIEIIKDEIQNLQLGNVDGDLLKSVKQNYLTLIENGQDSPFFRVTKKMQDLLLPQYIVDNEICIKSIKKADLSKLAKKMTLTESYYLK